MAYQDYDASFQKLYEKVLAYPTLSAPNKKAIAEHIEFLKAKPSDVKTLIKHLYHLYRFLKVYPASLDFKKAKREDIQKAMVKLETLKTDAGEPLAPDTKRNVRVVIKAFWKHLKGDDEFYPKEVRWITTSGHNNKRLLPKDLLDENDVVKMIDASDSFRNKAIIALLYDSGIRIGELVGMSKKDVELDGENGVINVNGKTGMRRIPITFSIRYIAQYLNLNKEKAPEEPLWLGEKNWVNSKTDYSGIRKMLQEAGAKAKIAKPVNPHAFRHSRATFYANRLTDRQMMEYFGWRNPAIISTYTHLSGRDIDNAIHQANGMAPTEPASAQKSKFEDRKCRRCDYNNTIDAVYCNRCGAPLERKEAMNDLVLNDAVQRIINEPNFLSVIKEAVRKAEAKKAKQ